MSLLSQFFPSGGGGAESVLSTAGAFTVDFMLVGGGGGGGSLNPCVFPLACANPGTGLHPATALAGGGGGGRVVQVIGARVQTGVSYPITVGAGGAANASGSATKFADFIAGGGANGGGDPTGGIAGYYYQTLTNSVGMAGGDAAYGDSALRCLSGSPLCPLYTQNDPLTSACRWSGRDGGAETRRQFTSYSQAITAGNYKETIATSGQICAGNTSPLSPCYLGVCFSGISNCGQSGGNSVPGYFTTWWPCSGGSGNFYPSFESPAGNPLGFTQYGNEIFKKNAIACVHCTFGMGGRGASGWTLYPFAPSPTTSLCYGFCFTPNGSCLASNSSNGHTVKGMFRESIYTPACSPNLPLISAPAFNRDTLTNKCGGNSCNYLTDYVTSGGARGEFPPISSPEWRLALTLSLFNGPLVCSNPGGFCRYAYNTFIDQGPKVGTAYFPGFTCNLQEWNVLETFDDGINCVLTNACGANGPYAPAFSCCNGEYAMRQIAGTWTPNSISTQSPGYGRLFMPFGPGAPASFMTWSGSYCACMCNPLCSVPLIGCLAAATPYVHTATWVAADAGRAGSGNGGGGGLRMQGYCDSNSNIAWRYAVTPYPFIGGAGPVWLSCMSGAYLNSPSGCSWWPIVLNNAPGSIPNGVKCFTYAVPCTPPAVLTGGAGGSGSVWIVYPTELPAATVTGNTAVPSPPAFRVYYWEGNGSITFNA